MEHTYRYTINK